MKCWQPTGTPPNRMRWFTAILCGVMVLATCEGTANELNAVTSELPVQQNTTTGAPPVREAVTDFYKAPLAAFKVQVPPTAQIVNSDEEDLIGLPLGKAENNTDTTPTPPFSNLWFNAGQSLGSAANSLTGWLNSRLVPQPVSTTTKPPDIVVRLQTQQSKKKPLISIDTNASRKKSQGNRVRPSFGDTDVDGDDEDVDDEEDYDGADEEDQVDDVEDSKPNRYSSNNNSDEEDDANIDEDEEEEEVRPVKKRKGNKKQPQRRRPNQNNRPAPPQYEEDEEEDYGDEYDYDDDEVDVEDYDLPQKNSGRQQQQQSLFNRFRQLAQIPYSTNNNNKQKNGINQPQKPAYRPVRIVQNGQVLQLVEDRPYNKQQNVKRRRRPQSNGGNTFQLVPVRNNKVQANLGQQQKRKPINKPNQTDQIRIPIPQSLSSQKRPNQFITIPWSQLGISNPQNDNQQSAPIIVNIPQYALQQGGNRRRRPSQNPTQVISAPQRKRLRRPISKLSQNGQVYLTDQDVRDIFRVPEIPPSRTPQRPVNTNDMMVETDDDTTNNPDVSPQSDPEVKDDANPQEPYIVVGDDDTEDEVLPRSVTPKRFLHYGGSIKPYVDVLNKGRFYLKSGRQMRMDFDGRPESKITSISPQRIVDMTTESLSDTKANVLPTISSQDTSTTGNPLSQ